MSPHQDVFLDWVLDPRPMGHLKPDDIDPRTNAVKLSSKCKGNYTTIAEQLGVTTACLALWRKDERFKAKYRQAIEDEVRDPTHMMDVIRHVRNLATGNATVTLDDGTVVPQKDADALKAADLYARLTGYIAPEAPKALKPASQMSDEELEAARAEREAPKGSRSPSDVVVG
jgi:hypothetical protein